MSDSISDIQKEILKFRDERDWKQFHKIKDLLLGLNIEVGELQELLLWKNEHEQSEIDKEKVENELADIFIFLVYLSEHFQVDLIQAVKSKIELNKSKYPVEKSKGSNKKYSELKD